MLLRLGLRLRIFLIFAALGVAALSALGLGLWAGAARAGGTLPLQPMIQAGVIGGFLILGLVAAVWYLFDLNVARPIDGLAGALRARADADVTGTLDGAIARYLGDLAPAATVAAERLAETRSALAQSVARETARLATEKARLESLLSDVPVGVLQCTADHQIVFYNSQAVDILGLPGSSIGLARPLFDYLRKGPVALAHDRLVALNDPEAASDLICTTTSGARALGARMRLSLTDGGAPGYVLTLRDVTADLAAHARLDALVTEILDRVRRPAANMQAMVDALPPGDPIPPAFETAFRAEAARLAQSVTELDRRHDADQSEGWPLTMTRASDLADGLRARLDAHGIASQARAAPLLLRCNGFDLIALLAGLGAEIARAGLVRGATQEMTVTIDEEETGAVIRLFWRGPALPVGQLDIWLAAPLDPLQPDLPRRQVLAAHATEIWPEHDADGTASLCLPIRHSRRAGPRPAPIDRRVVYDFDLLTRDRGTALAETRLDALTCVVFDTETTGLLPGQGDEIVQIAAVRVVNGRRVEGEVLDMLVNPGRPIPAASTAVHGITEAMVSDAPDVDTALRRFHGFAQGAVLVAHNAPFDMAFLRRREAGLGLRFDHPILDTVLLSAVIWGEHEVHSLDALTHRLAITIPEEARHTALGDAVATADALLKLMAMLRGKGLVTFGDLLGEVRRHSRLLRDLNVGA